MKAGSQKVVFFLLGACLLWVITILFQSLAREGPDRGNAVQVPLVLMVLGAPAVAYVLRRRRGPLTALLVVQLGLYVLYETGISIHTNIRSDLLLLYPAILFTAWMALRPEAVAAN